MGDGWLKNQAGRPKEDVILHHSQMTPYYILFIFFHVNSCCLKRFFVASTSSPNKNRHQEDCVGDTQKFHDGLVMNVEQLAIFHLTKWEANEKLDKGWPLAR